MKLTMFSFTEPFLEAVPQVIVLLCIGFLSGIAYPDGYHSYSSKYDGYVDGCVLQNCGIVSLLGPNPDPWFLGTFCLSVFSASFGMTRFLKVGPMTLVPRNSYGVSFFIAFFLVAIAIVSKGSALAFLLTYDNRQPPLSISFWIGACVLPSFLYVSTYIVDTILYLFQTI